MTSQSAAGRKTEESLQIRITDTVRLTLDGVHAALARVDVSPDREREINSAVRLGAVSAQLTHAYIKLRQQEHDLW